MQDPRREAAARLMAWYREMGVDAVLADAPVDWLAHGPAAPGETLRLALIQDASSPPPAAAAPHPALPHAAAVPASPRQPPPAASAATMRGIVSKPPDAAESAARTAARAAQSLSELSAAIAAFDGCGLKATATRACVYRGAETARLMIVGEAPGREEDLEGRPFVGRAGQLLDKMLAAIGLNEKDVHITNVVYWRPPGNRTPTPHEAQVCRPFLERQIELVDPEIILPLGGPAAKHLLDVTEGIMRVRGKWREARIGNRKYRALASLHPAYLLRTPAAKRMAWQDFLAIKLALSQA